MNNGKLPRIPNVYAVVCDPKYERIYPWGSCEVRNEDHSDFLRLQKLVFEAGNT
jgi:septin family protein